MHIEELKEGELQSGEEGNSGAIVSNLVDQSVIRSDVKRIVVGVGARVLFYPTLLYNVFRNKLQTEFRWWDRVDEFILLGAVPFPADVPRLKEVGVGGVITLNEPYETLVPSTLYRDYDIDHLTIPTRDYCFAPLLSDICIATNFIHKNASHGQTTYVHCKAGRGRSTTVVICYLVQYKQMTPDEAYKHVKSIRPRVLLASSQWQAVLEFYHMIVQRDVSFCHIDDLGKEASGSSHDLITFDDSSVVVVKGSDLEGYDSSISQSEMGDIWADLNVVCRVRVAGQAALTRISCLWLSYREKHHSKKISGDDLGVGKGCSLSAAHLEGFSVDIHVY
ncbi:putative dual specificity protein phosphatase DSP8 [Cucurbita pepo subsp. pepo]|uniref:putative dual specificity protein phosphatase DSP8 n=1 Tax=Cucurbita pepo subsp. pepo TaxID=3664 RepID=UPI000C9D5DCF|nr:putative dual specificity protein phosphatase DSP8 [Cucurbita pepo subsp. pepo]